MRSQILRTRIFKATPTRQTLRTSMSGIPSETAQIQNSANMSTSTNTGDLGIESTNINTATGVHLNSQQKVLVGSILDLFKGLPTLQKLRLWADDASFNDPLTIATGRKQYEAQWYGLKAAFSEITQIHQEVKSAGNPITLDLKTRYKLKGIGSEKTIESVVKIHTDASGEKITKVEDRWNGEIPEGAFAKAFRNLNSVTVPAFVSVPKSDEEDAKQ